MKKLSRSAQVAFTLGAAAFLTACGSGNNVAISQEGDGLVPGTQVPISATLDAAAATEFVRSVVNLGEANAETPLVLGDAVLATSETLDPAGV